MKVLVEAVKAESACGCIFLYFACRGRESACTSGASAVKAARVSLGALRPREGSPTEPLTPESLIPSTSNSRSSNRAELLLRKLK